MNFKHNFNPIPPRRGSWRLPAHSNHYLSNMDRVKWLKALWQYNFKSPARLRRMSFIVHYQKFKEFWIWKYEAKFFLIFQAFFINLWSRGNHSWLWNQGSCVRILAAPFLFFSVNVGFNGIWTWGLQIQSQLCLPLHHWDWSFDPKKISSVTLLDVRWWEPPLA